MNALSTTETTPEPTFDTLKLSSEVRRALDEIGYTKPTPVQLATYEPAVSGRDVIVQARTGTGKTAAFAIPIADRLVSNKPGVQALVLAPTRELALQSARELDRIAVHRGLRTVAVYGGAPMGKQVSDLAEGAQVVSGTPGRVLDHLRRGTLDPSGIRVLVLDEMDEMLSMGFARELNAILELIPDRDKRQTMCFSATVDEDIRRHAERYMKDPVLVSLSSDAVGAEAISHFAYMISGRDRAGDLIRVLEVDDPESAIIFCNMRSETEHVAQALTRAGFQADWLNGDLPQREREEVMARTREGKLRYLVATDVAARGIDVSHITHVINYSFPESTAVYVHRTGRTGRAGRTGCAISLVSPIELARLYYLRLQYKIFPVERTLPSAGELKTRAETDRIGLITEAFAIAATQSDLTLARRLLTHPEAEHIVAGLVGAFFGGQGDEVDERAAVARRTRAPEPVARVEEREDERPNRRPAARARGERGNEPRDQAPRGREPREPRDQAPRSREPRDQAPRDQAPRDQAPRDQAPRDQAPRDQAPRDQAPRDQAPRDQAPRDQAPRDQAPRDRSSESARGGSALPPRDRSRDRPARAREEAPREQVQGEGQRGSDAQTQPREQAMPRERAPREQRPREHTDGGAESQASHDELGMDGDNGATAEDSLFGVVYLDLGRRDGVRIGELARLVREVGELERDEVGRIRVRDRHTFVEVPKDKLDHVVEKLHGHVFNDKPLAAERAKR